MDGIPKSRLYTVYLANIFPSAINPTSPTSQLASLHQVHGGSEAWLSVERVLGGMSDSLQSNQTLWSTTQSHQPPYQTHANYHPQSNPAPILPGPGAPSTPFYTGVPSAPFLAGLPSAPFGDAPSSSVPLTTSLTLGELEEGTDYVVRARLANTYGWGNESEPFMFSTKKGNTGKQGRVWRPKFVRCIKLFQVQICLPFSKTSPVLINYPLASVFH